MTTQEMIEKLEAQIIYGMDTKSVATLDNQFAVDILFRLKELRVIEKVVERKPTTIVAK